MPGFRAYHRQFARTALFIAVCALVLSGCGTTRWSDSSRTGTEQLLISNAIDRAVGEIDFTPLSEKKVFLKADAVAEATDNKYLVMALRQHMAACGGILCDYREDADYVVEIRAGAIGTDRDDMLIGIPAFTMPSIPGTEFSAATIPEVPFVKRTRQRGVAKIAAFAYNRHTGRPLWASGNNQGDSTARNLWIAGTGPLTRGSIYSETTFAGDGIPRWMAAGLEAKGEKHHDTFADRSMIFVEQPGAEPLATPMAATDKSKEGNPGIAAVSPPPPRKLPAAPLLPGSVHPRPTGIPPSPVPAFPEAGSIFNGPVR